MCASTFDRRRTRRHFRLLLSSGRPLVLGFVCKFVLLIGSTHKTPTLTFTIATISNTLVYRFVSCLNSSLFQAPSPHYKFIISNCSRDTHRSLINAINRHRFDSAIGYCSKFVSTISFRTRVGHSLGSINDLIDQHQNHYRPSFFSHIRSS